MLCGRENLLLDSSLGIPAGDSHRSGPGVLIPLLRGLIGSAVWLWWSCPVAVLRLRIVDILSILSEKAL